MKHGASIHTAFMAIDRPRARAVELGTPIALALAAAVLVALLACGGAGAGGTSVTPDAGTTTPDAGTTTPDAGTVPVDGTKGTGSGGTGLPQPSTDAAAWFITDGSTSVGQAIDIVQHGIDFDAIQGAVQGGTAVGQSRPDGILVYNASRKTDLTVTAVTVGGANAADFVLDQANVDNALATTIPPNKSAFVRIGVTFTPQGAGPRTGSVALTSNAGTASVSLKGTGLLGPVIQVAPASLTFISTSAPAPVHVTNAGAGTLHVTGIAITGPDASAFQTVVTNQGLFRCYPGVALGAQQSCDLEVGLVAGQIVPKNATLALDSDDPANATVNIPLTLQ